MWIGKCCVYTPYQIPREELTAQLVQLYGVFLDVTLASYSSLNNCTISVANEDHTEEDCFICCISTHGDQDLQPHSPFSNSMQLADLIYGYDGILYLRLITDMFTEERCPTLAGKPKLFFIQVYKVAELVVLAKYN